MIIIDDQETLERLANAIIKQAADDYRSSHRKLLREPHNCDAKERISEVERFLVSKWYRTLTVVDGDYILQMLKKEVCGYKPKKYKAKKGKKPGPKPKKTA